MSTMIAERDYLLDELGDPDAPVGSRLWSLYMHHAIRRDLYETNQSEQRLHALVKNFKEAEAWESLGYASWQDYCRMRLNAESERVDTKAMMLAKNAKPLNKNGTNRYTSLGFRDQETLPSYKGGASPEYLMGRIARDHPDILELMKAGEFRSLNQAAIAAGIISPRTRERLYLKADNPQQAGRYLAERVDREWIEAMIEEYLKAKNEKEE